MCKHATISSMKLLIGTLFLVLGSQMSAQESESIGFRIDSYLSDLASRGEFSGAVLLAVEGETVLSKGYGLSNVELGVANSSETKFRIGSITKQFTSMAILILQERGKLSVHDSLGIHLSVIPSTWEPLTLHQILTHTSGLMHSWPLPEFAEFMMVPQNLDDILSRFHDEPLLYPPGQQFNYSGLGYFILAKVIEEVSGIKYHEFLDREIFEPIGMRNTGGDRPETVLESRANGYVFSKNGELMNAPTVYMPILTGGGDLYSTVEDLNVWNRALNDGQLISPASYELLYEPELANYAYGWQVDRSNDKLIVRHAGSVPGFRALIVRIPSEETCYVILSNNSSNPLPPIATQIEEIIAQ